MRRFSMCTQTWHAAQCNAADDIRMHCTQSDRKKKTALTATTPTYDGKFLWNSQHQVDSPRNRHCCQSLRSENGTNVPDQYGCVDRPTIKRLKHKSVFGRSNCYAKIFHFSFRRQACNVWLLPPYSAKCHSSHTHLLTKFQLRHSGVHCRCCFYWTGSWAAMLLCISLRCYSL